MSHDEHHLTLLRELLDGQLLGVLGTQGQGAPYTSLVGFAATADLGYLLFATGRATRKHANLVADMRASMLIDNRTNTPKDFTHAAAATAVGAVEEVAEDEAEAFDALFLGKLPHLESFVRSPSCARLRIRVSSYLVVTRFQDVVEVRLET